MTRIISLHMKWFDNLGDNGKRKLADYIVALHKKHDQRRRVEMADWSIEERKLDELRKKICPGE